MDIYSSLGIKSILSKNNYLLSKKRGQNYLADKFTAFKIVEIISSYVDKGVNVLEVGSGLGAITIPLATKYKKVISIEIDKGISNCLKEVLKHYDVDKKVEVLNKDFLKLHPQEIIRSEFDNWVFVSNLPYSVGGEILKKVMYEYPIQDIFVMVQKEFFERLIAKVDSPNYSFLSVIMQLNSSEIIKLMDVGRNLFFPVPSVDSVFIYIRKNPKIVDRNTALIIQKLFTTRRKNILNSINILFSVPKDKTENLLFRIGIDRNTRIENLHPEIIKILVEEIVKLQSY